MKEHVVKFAALLLVCCAMLGCGKTDDPSDGGNSGSGSIYGTVTDLATGSPVSNANVQLRPGGETTLTGYKCLCRADYLDSHPSFQLH